MTRVHKQLILLLILLALALSGCSAISNEEASASDSEQVAQATAAPMAEPTATAEPEPTEVTLGPPPAFHEELQATDPQTVVLGAGRPQLVELFAFW